MLAGVIDAGWLGCRVADSLLTDLALRSQQLEDAAKYCQQAQFANQAVNDPTESAAILYAQAKLDHFLGDHAAGLANAIQSAQLYTAMGDRKATAIVNHFVGRLYLAGQNSVAAQRAAEHGLLLARALEDSELIEMYESQLEAVAKQSLISPV